MAVLNKIRQRSLVLIIVIALALFSFVLADLFRNNNAFSSKSQNVVASINGKDISREDFMRKVEVAQRNQPTTPITQIMNSVYRQELSQAIYETQYNELGLSVERDHMREILKNALATNPEFLNEDNVYDENKLNEFIANLKEISPDFGFINGNPIDYSSWKDYEQRISVSALRQDYQNLAKAGVFGTQFDGKTAYLLESEKRDLRYVQIPFTSIPDSTVTVSKAEIEKYIKDNSEQYQVEESRNIQYVEFKNVASAEDEEEIKSELAKRLVEEPTYVNGVYDTIPAFAEVKNNEAYVNEHSDEKFEDRYLYKSALPEAVADTIFNLNIGEVYGPYKDGNTFKLTKVLVAEQLADSVKSSHIIVPFIGSRAATPETTKTKEQAKAYVDSILPLVKNDVEKFKAVASEINTDGSKANEGEVGWTKVSTFNPNAFDPDYADFIFSNEAGSVDIVETQFGYHIIRVDEKKAKAKAVKLATIVRNIQPSVETEDDIFRVASNFELAVGSRDFQEVANEGEYTVRPVNQIKALDENIPGVGNQRQIVQWAFNEETKVGDVKRFDIGATGYVIAQLTGKNKEGLMSVQEASVPVTAILRKEKKAKLIKDRITATTIDDVSSAENVSARTATAVTMKTPTISGAGNEPYVVGAAFALNEGETSPLLTGEKGVYMVEVTKIEKAVDLDNYQSFANQIQQQLESSVNSKLYQALEDAAEIEDNRAKTVQ
jgi:parvulin-like peptidyl-prolyl isomerase